MDISFKDDLTVILLLGVSFMCLLFLPFCPELKFLDKLTKDLSLLHHAIHSPIYWGILKKTILFSGFKKPYKKFREIRELESIHE
jgi:hypothetical protein